MPLDYIDPRIGVPLAVILWLFLFVLLIKDPVMLKIDNFFARRRHIRREKNRVKNSAEITRLIESWKKADEEIGNPLRNSEFQ